MKLLHLKTLMTALTQMIENSPDPEDYSDDDLAELECARAMLDELTALFVKLTVH